MVNKNPDKQQYTKQNIENLKTEQREPHQTTGAGIRFFGGEGRRCSTSK